MVEQGRRQVSNHMWDIYVGNWVIGWVTKIGEKDFVAHATGHFSAEVVSGFCGDSKKYESVEAAQEAILALFKRRIKEPCAKQSAKSKR